MPTADHSDVVSQLPRSRRGPVPVGVSIEELKDAWKAIGRGDFRVHDTVDLRSPETAASDQRPPFPGRRPENRDETSPEIVRYTPAAGEQVLPVIGCHGHAGSTTLALAIAEAAPGVARVVECASPTASGLSGASTAELGVTHDGLWREGRRGGVTLLRVVEPVTTLSKTPTPPVAEPGDSITVLDPGCEASQLVIPETWLSETVVNAITVVVVTSATVAGLRRLESAIELLELDDRAIVAVVGRGLRHWPRPAAASIGPRSRRILRAGRCVAVPIDHRLRTCGIDSAPLPSNVMRAAGDLLALSRQSLSPSASTLEGTDR